VSAPVVTANQRWVEGRASYRPPDEPIRTLDHEVTELPDDTTPREFIERHHYAHSFPAARVRFGLYRGAELVGAAVFAQPQNNKIVTNLAPGLRHTEGLVLSRFVLLDRVAGNGETWFLGRAFEVLRRRGDVRVVVSFSDPVERTNVAGEVVKPGHVGTIYQAFNGQFRGRATPRTLKLFPDGTVFDSRTTQKIRAHETGWEAAVQLLLSHGAPAPPRRGDLRAWLRRAIAQTTRSVRHPGNFRYVWPIGRSLRRVLGSNCSACYPKRVAS
jgi:hypothetical protein